MLYVCAGREALSSPHNGEWLVLADPPREGVDIGQGVAGSVYEARAEVEAIALGLADDAKWTALRAGDARRSRR